MRTRRVARGFTMVELVVALGASALMMALVMQAFTTLARTHPARQMVSKMQSAGRQGLAELAADLRQASLSVGSGVVWVAKGGAPTSRPTIQLVENVPGGGWLTDVKPGTDALLVVRGDVQRDGVPTGAVARVAVVGDVYSTTGALPVTAVGDLTATDRVLIGEYQDAAWVPLSAVDGSAKQLTLSAPVNVFPGTNAVKLASGSFVRRARARLYFVSTADELVRLDLNQPYLPAAASGAGARVVLARGVENMQLDCAIDTGTSLGGCAGPLDSADPVVAESAGALGTFTSGAGPRLNAANVHGVRTVTLSIAMRSDPLADLALADPPVSLNGVALSAGGVPSGTAVIRRAYQLTVGVRNTSLTVL